MDKYYIYQLRWYRDFSSLWKKFSRFSLEGEKTMHIRKNVRILNVTREKNNNGYNESKEGRI